MILGHVMTALCVFVVSLSSMAVAVDGASAKDVVVKPNWLTLPTPETLEAFFPPGAQMAGVSGGALVKCNVEIDTTVSHCTVLTETPPGFGFGEAAIAVTPAFRLSPETVNGRAVVAEARIPVVFNIDGRSAVVSSAPTLADAIAKTPESIEDARAIAAKLAPLDPSIQGLLRVYSVWMGARFYDEAHKVPPVIFKAFQKAVGDFSNERQDRVAAALTIQFTRQQLKDLRIFLETPTGLVFPARLSATFIQSMGSDKDLMLSFMDAWRSEACSTSKCTDKQVETFISIRSYIENMSANATDKSSEPSAVPP